MAKTINAKQLRASLPSVVERVRRGERFTVLYRSQPVFRIVPIGDSDVMPGRLEDDPVFKAEALGSSSDEMTSADHDTPLYGRRPG